jgi:hypothetical protein
MAPLSAFFLEAGSFDLSAVGPDVQIGTVVATNTLHRDVRIADFETVETFRAPAIVTGAERIEIHRFSSLRKKSVNVFWSLLPQVASPRADAQLLVILFLL